jgi:SAM-dependent methyltransferase
MLTDHTSFIRYLAAKKLIDDRSLNSHVFQTLTKTLKDLIGDKEILVLEAGCGIGSMIERMLAWGALTNASYTALDLEPEYLAEAVRQLVRYGNSTGMEVHEDKGNVVILQNHNGQIRIEFKVGDVIEFAGTNASRREHHLILAHAFLDLIDIYSSLPPILSLVRPGGLVYFTLNFDGVTSLEPTIEADLDRQIISLYHETMDHRLIQGKPSGDSQTGRHLLPFLQKSGLNILAAGASDWVVFPTNDSYQDDDAYFLHFMVETIYRAIKFQPEINPGQLHSWTDARHGQVEHGKLFYVAHQLDVLAQMPWRQGNNP